jgi:hypothetical protein
VNRTSCLPHRRLRHHPFCYLRPFAVPVRWIPRGISVPMPTVGIAAGSGGAICGPTAIPVAARGDNFSAPRARATSLEHHGTIFHGKRASVECTVRVIACLAEGLGIRGTARVFEVDPHTVRSWLVEAAEQLQAFSALTGCKFQVPQNARRWIKVYAITFMP